MYAADCRLALDWLENEMTEALVSVFSYSRSLLLGAFNVVA